uniref:uncharacterized protein LOC105350210 n=1 Tax=Fragaria vesca subsp. vesca TaxID=101020 RepID=UPI0005CAA7D1|nr:PREDICTED: uncharacterized protein LOC105350210 [Fragaria vesca subsp. vesca]
MEDMRKRPGGDVTPDDASSSSSSPSAKRRRDQAAEESADISIPPVSNDVVLHSGDFAPVVNAVVSVPPVANDVVTDSGDVSVSPAVVAAGVDVISVPPVVNDVMDGGDVSVPPPANDVGAVIVDVWAFPPVNDVVAKSGGGISIPPAVNGVVSVPPVFNDNDVIGDVSVPPAVNDVVAVMVDVWDPPPANDVVMASDDDETLSELTRLLDLNNADVAAPETSLTFAENPSRSPRVFQTMSTSYVTINGNEESCGSSFSDADSSVMASVDMSQVWMGGHEWYTAESAWDMDDAEMWAREVIEAPELDADWDDAALARFLGEDLNPDQLFSGTN